MRRLATAAMVLAACGDDGDGDVRGPFTGEVHRFVVDRFVLPSDDATSAQLAADLDGDGTGDNQLGVMLTALGVAGDLTTHGPDMIASGAIASYVELQADDLDDDAAAGVTLYGRAGDAATVIGGRIAGGAFVSNRAATTRVPGAAIARLPVFEDADPVALALAHVELDLGSDGAGGYDAVVRGGLPADATAMAAYAGVLAMMTTNPQGHTVFARVLDLDKDGALTLAEVAESSLLSLLLRPDVTFAGEPHLSFAFGLHLAPAPSGAPPATPCADRVRDGDESDVDCGGTSAACPRCPEGAACAGPADCQTAGCDGGRCRAATCGDGVRDGFEGDTDCGAACPVCANGARCAANPDCASGSCTATVGMPGTCVP